MKFISVLIVLLLCSCKTNYCSFNKNYDFRKCQEQQGLVCGNQQGSGILICGKSEDSSIGEITIYSYHKNGLECYFEDPYDLKNNKTNCYKIDNKSYTTFPTIIIK